MAKVIVLVSVLTVLPPASSMVTVGWVDKAMLLTAPEGWVVKTSWDAEPTVTLNGALTPTKVPSEGSLALSVYPVPAASILQPEKAATPATVVGLQPERVPALGLVPMASVIVLASVVTVLP